MKTKSIPSVELNQVSMRYHLLTDQTNSIKDYVISLILRRHQYRDFWAIKNISANIHKGECFGVIGKNAAGKSTLLKVISRVLSPTEGSVVTRGRVSPMLGLGTGFHAEMSGEENIYLNSSILGYSKPEIDSRLDSIIEFSELGDFIHIPLRNYSQGMRARLGFAVATEWQPDILLLDEVLQVGDLAFKEKCLTRMMAFINEGSTTVLVSHSMKTILDICQRAMWIDQGEVQLLGPATEVVAAYREFQQAKKELDKENAPSSPVRLT